MSETDKQTLTIFNDSVLDALYAKCVATFGEFKPIKKRSSKDYFGALCESIISQQLSTKVADVIIERALKVVGGTWHPEKVLAVSIEDLRSAGLSNAKATYIHNSATAWVTGIITTPLLESADDETVIQHLVQIKGVGQWTAEMFLIFTLGRKDVFSVGDYGLRKAVCRAYDLEITCNKSEIQALSIAWSPQRSLACRVLWKSLELPMQA